MRKFFTVARWEYLEKIKSKAFIISLFLTPAIMAGFGILPTLFADRPDAETRVIGIIDQNGSITTPLSNLIEQRYKLPNGQPNYILRPLGSEANGDPAKAKAGADSLVMKEKIEGYFIIGPKVFTDTAVQYRAQNVGSIRINERFSQSIREIILAEKLKQRGIDSSAIKDFTAPMEIKSFKVTATGKGGEEESGFGKVFLLAYSFLMAMFFVVMTSGQLLVRSMLEEKSNRIVEVLVSSCSTGDLMAGKILGLSGLGLTQVIVWLLLAITFAGPFIATAFTPASAALFFVYFIFGYLFYASVFVAFGAPVSTEQEAQQLTSYLILFLVVPIALVVPIIENPDSTLARVLSFIPPITPTMMAMRIAVKMPNPIEIVGTLLLLAVSAFGMMKAAGKIFRTTILLTGKKPSMRELIRIVRTK